MKLVTNIKIDYPTGVDTVGNDFVTLELGTKAFTKDMGLHVNPEYSVPNGDFKADIDSFVRPKTDLQALYDVISTGLPDPNVDFPAYIETMFMEAAKIEFMNTFSGITALTQIDLIP